MKKTFFTKNVLTKEELQTIKGQRNPNDPKNICLADCIESGGTQAECIQFCY